MSNTESATAELEQQQQQQQEQPTTRKRHRSAASKRSKKGRLQTDLEFAIQRPAGVQRTFDMLRSSSKRDIQSLPDDWSPLVGVILLVGSIYTRRFGSRMPSGLIPTILQLIDYCHDCGISVDGGSIHGDHLHRPLILAAYYGFSSLVQKLLQVGATPDLAEGDGRTALHAAFQNPAGQPHILRDCDREVVQLLWVQHKLVTTSLKEWMVAPPGRLMCVNGDAANGSPLLSAIRNKNISAAQYLVNHGAVITDRDYLTLMHKRGGQQQLLFLATSLTNKHSSELLSWSSETDWSFPPTWKVAIILSNYCGLPEEVFKDCVVPFCGRDWFFAADRCNGPLPARLGASMGEDGRNMGSRSVRWKKQRAED